MTISTARKRSKLIWEAIFEEAIFEDGDPPLIAAGLGDIARARGMTKVARDTGLSREGLYKALDAGGNPELATILKVMKALGFQLSAKPV